MGWAWAVLSPSNHHCLPGKRSPPILNRIDRNVGKPRRMQRVCRECGRVPNRTNIPRMKRVVLRGREISLKFKIERDNARIIGRPDANGRGPRSNTMSLLRRFTLAALSAVGVTAGADTAFAG